MKLLVSRAAIAPTKITLVHMVFLSLLVPHRVPQSRGSFEKNICTFISCPDTVRKLQPSAADAGVSPVPFAASPQRSESPDSDLLHRLLRRSVLPLSFVRPLLRSAAPALVPYAICAAAESPATPAAS